jgi:putative transposase
LWKRTRTSHKSKQNLIKKEIGQADLDMLELAAAAGDIHLKYLDESGFSLWAQVYYTYLFSLPSYCSEMNRIENEWQRIKEDELAGRMFSDEYELAIAVMSGVEARYKQDLYEVKRYHFQRE